MDRAQYQSPELSKPPAERARSKQTVIPIRKPGSDYFRISPDPDTQLLGVDILLTASGRLKVLTNQISTHLLPRKSLKKVNLYLAKNEHGDFFVIYFSTGAESWLESSLLVAEAAEKEWISIEAAMQDGGYRINYARSQYPKMAAMDPAWGNPQDDEPVQMFETAVIQNTAHSDRDPAVAKLLETRR